MRFRRSAGILLHPTSLPGKFGSGDLGSAAYHFVDWLVSAGQAHWQMLPIGPIGMGNSPYMSLSAFAGNPLLIDLEDLQRRGWLQPQDLANVPSFPTDRVDFSSVIPYRRTLLEKGASTFFKSSDQKDRKSFDLFSSEQKSWLEDYALFSAIQDSRPGEVWTAWAPDLALRKRSALQAASNDLRRRVEFHKFAQWIFSLQWTKLKQYANSRGVRLIGDIPIFVAHHSSDVWSHPDAYELNEHGNPRLVAGVPPDYFSKTGQRWGNPLYKWNVMKKQKFRWWVDRFRRTLDFFDILRIDHFRGFAGYYAIPASEKTAERGTWLKGPGAGLFNAVDRTLGKLPIIAEDLGLMTPDVTALRDRFQYPGMKILQFAFSDGADNPFLPHNFVPNCVVYTGTHDNDTTIGWYGSAPDHEKDFVRRYSATNGADIHWTLIRIAYQSVADMAIIPFQDVLGLGTKHRMNYPGTSTGNWEWRFSWDMVQPIHASAIRELTLMTGRIVPEKSVSSSQTREVR
ncbi:MAG TPA: 4-alpha-glucanotransferase [Bacteroidota bacterium]|nr:4-alpha-glucanotransferase [Bacteroidota bacterium]